MKPVFFAGLLALCGTPSLAEEFVSSGLCVTEVCDQSFRLHSLSEGRSYGLLVVAPEAGCKRVRYVINSDAALTLGRTPPLGPGEVAIVRMGRGFAEGGHDLTIVPVGCGLGPATARRVTLAKTSPDHGWRSAGP